MTRTAFYAFDTIRTSGNDYPWASRDIHGIVRFHATYAAATRMAREVVQTRSATADDKRRVRAAKAEADAARKARAAAIMADW